MGYLFTAVVIAIMRELVLAVIERSAPIEAWIIDDTGFPKKGPHSVGWERFSLSFMKRGRLAR